MSSTAVERPSASRARPVKPRPMINGIRPPARTPSRMTLVFNSNSAIVDPSSPVTLPSWGYTVILSPMFMLLTSNSMGRAPLSSMVLKKMGAILPPKHNPPPRMFGTYGMSSPICHRTLLVADLRDEPVPTTSPTYANGNPFALSSSN